MNNGNPVPLANVLDLMMDAICVVDAEGRFVYLSAACERIFGYRPEELVGRTMIELVVPQDRERTLQAAREIMSGQPMLNFENRYLRKDGQLVHVLWSARWSASDGVRIAVARDITARKRAESLQAALYAISEAAHAARDLEALLGHIRQILGELLPARGLFVALQDAEGGHLEFPYLLDEERKGASSAVAAALCAQIVRSGKPLLQADSSPAGLSAGAGRDCWLGVPLEVQHGTIGALLLRDHAAGAGYGDKDRELLQFVSAQVATAIERKRLHARLEYAAQYDGLTGLANRTLLFDRLKTALARARRSGDRLALLYLDLDGFKQVNDSLGHAVGDLLLQEVARRLQGALRAADTAARVGGDEFVVLLENIRWPEQAAQVAEKVRRELSLPVSLPGGSLAIAPSIGIAVYPEDGEVEAELLRRADEAMYAAKSQRVRPLAGVRPEAGFDGRGVESSEGL
jgi:diguanylate cyclase (GGDEF)-like protein/PAS domain S-box-containing protein